MPKFIPGSFSVDHLGIYDGFALARDEGEDGTVAYPLFAIDVARTIAADWIAFEGQPDEPPAQAFYDSDDDAFHLYEPALNEWHRLEGKAFGPLRLYAMGEDLWTWHRARRKR